MSQDFTGKTVLITGATRGIGRGIAQVFAARGASVMAIGRNDADGAALVEELRCVGARAAFHAGDVSVWADVGASVAAAHDAFGPVDILCCNAGIYPAASIAEMPVEEWDRVMAVNLKSSFMFVKACLPDFQARPGGRAVLVSSITGAMSGHPGWSHYGASKAGQLGFLRSAALELAACGATINAVLPGNVAADAATGAEQAYERAMAAHIPVGRLGQPQELGHAAAFLASPEAGFITGQTLVVDGGQSLFEYQGGL
ncbi:3-oxoacyl-[acyl-carrier-protein] reductase [Pelagivirga sediminicola]|uniref:3-oxoacyl-[acyl-carrier-protein] reductase n=1 Tax=Pelagivirga sediminicola TaxID=2170575 RepID=A0A2T7GAB6_9RHOB|nr:SDR family NAD(P)-dependent oxidoreductase [Pelagivirga sediminicola]PVA11328.1 3-oxoacyl-[acyl-carrier-protein] reductase [Pelagivirga sediminicola]